MKKQIRILCSEADRSVLRELLEQLRALGLQVSEEAPGKNDIVLAALSEAFYADAAKTGALLELVAAGAENVLPLQLDTAPIPDTVKNALYARNIIPAAGRGAAHTAQRILDALPKQKSKLPLILTTAALVLIAVIGLLIWRASQIRETVPTMAEQEIIIPSAYALTQEDLDKIVMVSFISDQFYFFTRDQLDEGGFPNPVTHHMEDDGMHWDSTEDGHRLSMSRYSPEDLAFLKLLPNLQHLELVLVETEALPELGALPALKTVMLADCTISDISGLTGSGLEYIGIYRCPVKNYAILSECRNLKECEMEFEFQEQADLSAFSPPALEWAEFRHGPALRELDLSGLASCPKLRILKLQYGLPIRDLSFLRQTPALEELTLEELPAIRDISSTGTLKGLKKLFVGYCPGITDYSPIAGCSALESIHVQGDFNPDALRDASFLRDLPKLRDIHLYACNLNNMDFLEGIAAHQSSINLGFAGDILDYSGLAAIKRYEYLHVNPRYQNGSRGGDFSAVLPFIQDAQIDYLMLYSCADVDLSELPDGIRELSIRYGDLRDLSGLKPYSLRRLELWDCRYLGSLNGIETIPTMFGDRGQMELEIVGCPRLTDYVALSGSNLAHLKLVGQYSLPDLGSFQTRVLRLESIPELQDLHLLDALPTESKIGIDLVGLDEIRDLSPLRRLNGGHLIVPPQVAEQAEELVEEGVFDSFEVAYPDGSWQPFDDRVELLSLDELDTLPKALLRRVERLCIVGDTLIELEQGDIREEWEGGSDTPRLLFHNWSTDETTPIEYREGPFTDLSRLSELTGLRELKLYAQPLENLNGIQNLGELENFTAAYGPALTDASAAFACPELQWLNLYGCPIESIQGVQNLQNLQELNLNDTKVTDLSQLTQLDTSNAEDGNGGFRLQINGTPIEDYAPLSSIPVLDELDINDVEASRFLPCLEGVELHRLSACNVFQNRQDTDSNALFADFIRSHPQLKELWIPWNQGITDLSPVTELEELEYVRVSFDMKEALASLNGQVYGFTLEIEGG